MMVFVRKWLIPCFFFPMRVSSRLGLYNCITRRNCVNRLGTRNVRGINGTAKRKEVVDHFIKGKFKLLTLTETKLKGNEEVSWCGVNGIIGYVREMERARERMAVVLIDVWRSVVIDFGCVSSRTLWIKFRFARVKVCVVVEYGPNEGNGEDCG